MMQRAAMSCFLMCLMLHLVACTEFLIGVSASDHDGNVPRNVLDGSVDTRWSAQGHGQWLQLDFRRQVELSGIEAAFYQGDTRHAYFSLQVSNDALQWQTVFSGQSSGNSLDYERFSFPKQSLRYLRYVGQGNSVNDWNSLTAIRLPRGNDGTGGGGTDDKQYQVSTTTLYSTTAVSRWYTESVYSPLDVHNGAVYFVYLDADRYPTIGKIVNGHTTTYRLDVNRDYRAHNDGHHQFSLGIDEKGYIHVTGDMHNFPHFMPDNVPQAYRSANALYWVSDKPEDISTFTMVGTNSSRSFPGSGFSYGAFRNDRNGKLYYFTRALAQRQYWENGGRGLAVYAYDAEARQWHARGAVPPSATGNLPVVVWENSGSNGSSYQMYKADMHFDRNNRMHLSVSLNNDNPPVTANYLIYAYSDDGGLTFYRANGTAINSLPLRVDAGAGQADIVEGSATANIGQASVSVDRANRPAVHYTLNGKTYFRHWEGSRWSERQLSPINPIGATDRAKLYHNEVTGFTLFNGNSELQAMRSFTGATEVFHLGMPLRQFSYRAMRDSADLYGIHWNASNGAFRVVQIKFVEK